MKTLASPRNLTVEAIPPKSVRKLAEGHWFIDFARASFGTLAMVVETARTTTATLHLGEKLEAADQVDRNPPGSVRYHALTLPLEAGRQCLQAVIPPDTRNTGPSAIRMPDNLFEVMPFRYAEIVVEDGAGVSLHEARQLAVVYPFDNSAADFRCDDDRLNAVWELCKHTIKATSFCGVYVDGDRERIAYEGDAYINQLCHYGVDAEYEMARRTIEHLLFHPTWPTEWSLHCVPMVWADYQYTGRTDLIRAYFELLMRKALLSLDRGDGLISVETDRLTPQVLADLFLSQSLKDLVDWPPGSFTDGGQGERDGYDMVPVKTVINAFHAWNLELLAEMAAAIGKSGDAGRLRERHRRVRQRLHEICFRQDRGCFTDGEGSGHASLHANMFPAAFGLVPVGCEQSVLSFIRSRGMACSVYGAQYLLEACYRLGASGYALDLMTAEHDRGWCHMLRSGSTMTWEAWDHRYKNNLDWNHAWGAAPANIIPRFLAGVRPLTPGFESALLAPSPGRLTEFEAKVPTQNGPIIINYDALSPGKRWLLIQSPVPLSLDMRGLNGGSVTPAATGELLPPGRHEIAVKSSEPATGSAETR